MRTAAVYRRDLDLVVEAPDGSLAGTCTAWLDPASGWAELEPLGIVPAHRRRGLAQTLALDVCRRVGELGGHDVLIDASPLPYYRAPWDAYVAAGFTPMERGTRMRPRA
ncbi:GNAT superfamily N-acetyltransferase [Clavibacter michiganensis]